VLRARSSGLAQASEIALASLETPRSKNGGSSLVSRVYMLSPARGQPDLYKVLVALERKEALNSIQDSISTVAWVHACMGCLASATRPVKGVSRGCKTLDDESLGIKNKHKIGFQPE
jgi:hypothetical protein